METPGVSLFQGVDINIATSFSREEEEALAEIDHRRRDAELGIELQHAFDDLINDDDYSGAGGDSCFQTRLSNGQTDYEDICNKYETTPNQPEKCDQDENSNQLRAEIERLNHVIKSKNCEIENITKMVHDETKNNDELKKRLCFSEAEKDRALRSKKQSHELLVESKTKIAELEENIIKLKDKMKNLDNANNDLIRELEANKTMLSDAQHKYHLVEKNAGFTADRHADVAIRQANERHTAKIDMMQQQIDNIRGKLEDKESECKKLETRYRELERSREALLVDKAETINHLSRNLEDSQKKCQQLLSKQDYSHENIQLQRQNYDLVKQTEDMQATIKKLTSKLDATNSELALMDSILCESGDISGNRRRLSLTKSQNTGISNTPIASTERLNRLKDELYRSVSSQKAKREEIRKLEDQLANKNEEIKKIKNDENKALVEMTTYKEESIRLGNRLRILEAELDSIRQQNSYNEKEKSFCHELQQEIDQLSRKIVQLEQELKNSKKQYEIVNEKNNHLKSEIDDLCTKLKSHENMEFEYRKLTSEIKDLNIDYEELKQEHDNLKKTYDMIKLKEKETLELQQQQQQFTTILGTNNLELEKQKFLLRDSQKECDRLKNLYVEISNSKELLSAELTELQSRDLNKELYVQREKCLNLERALELSDLKCKEIEKLLENEKITHEDAVAKLKIKIQEEKAASIKNNSDTTDNNCSQCIKYSADLTKIEIQNLKLQNQYSTSIKELNELHLNFNEAQNKITDLSEKLGLMAEREMLITELKEKALQFEEYFIRNQNRSKETSSGISSPKQVESRDKSVETSPDLELMYNRRQLESRIREDMAKVFANKIKNAEEQLKQNFNELEKQNSSLKIDIQRAAHELQIRQNELEILKKAFLTEREQVEEILEKKDEEARLIIEKQTTMLHKCRDELKSKQNRVLSLLKDLEDRSVQIEAERQAMKTVMTQWETKLQFGQSKEEECRERIAHIRKEHETIVAKLQAKYHSAKKSAANYKRYAEDKDKHIMNEFDRIKSGYDALLEKSENHMKEVLQKQKKEMNEKIEEVESVYEAKLSQLRKNIDKTKNV